MKRETTKLTLIVFLCCAAMLVVDGLWQPGYWIKSGIKILLFLGIPLLCSTRFPDISLRLLFRPSGRGLLRALLLGLGVYAVILSAYFLLRGAVDFSSVLNNLPAGVTVSTFPFVALYISLVNSLLEEFFFRGFAFLTLAGKMRCASLFSAIAFAIYHTAMMLGWFPPAIFLLALVGLTIGGLLFNWLNQKDGSIYTSWLVHMFANFATNTVGFILFSQLAS